MAEKAATEINYNYALLMCLLVAHIVGIIAIINAAQINPMKKVMPAPMMVSLIKTPAPEPVLVPLLPTPPVEVIKTQKTNCQKNRKTTTNR